MTRQEWYELRDILIEKTQAFDEDGFPCQDGEYDICGWALPILTGEPK